MTHTIPEYFEHLPLYEGLPVPWVAMWSDEYDPAITRVHRMYGIDWIYSEHQTGTPNFGSTNSHRQREGMMSGACQICGKRGADTWVVPDDSEMERTHADLWEAGWIINPPLHEHCFHAARTLCPHLMKHEPLAIIKAKRFGLVAYTVRISPDQDAILPIGTQMPGHLGRQLIVDASRARPE